LIKQKNNKRKSSQSGGDFALVKPIKKWYTDLRQAEQMNRAFGLKP
jgi:hypothetical protein